MEATVIAFASRGLFVILDSLPIAADRGRLRADSIPMTLRDLLVDTLISLWTNKLRTTLTMFGIAWGIISIILMVAAGEGLRVGQKRVADNFGKDIMIIFAGRTSLQAGGNRAGRPIHW